MDVPLQVKRSRGKHPQRSPASIANDISSKFLEPSDLKELLSLRSTVFEERTHVLKELAALFVSDPNTKVKLVFFEDKLLIKSIFLMLSNMQDVALKSPRHLFVDFISSFVPGYDFYTVFCEEKDLAWKACAWCFTRKGTADNLRFIMVSIFQSIPTLKVQVKEIMVNPDILDAIDLEVFIPRASVRYCMPLVLETLCQKVSHLDSSTKDQVKNILYIMAHTPSLKIYNQYLDELKAICPAEIFQYYLETWHPCRNMWMKKDDRTQDAERSIGASLHTAHQALLDQVGCPPSLHHGLQVVLSNSKPLLAITEPFQELSSKSHVTSSDMKERKSASVKKRTLSSWISDCIELCYQREHNQPSGKVAAHHLRAAATAKTDEVTSPEEDEKDESLFQVPGESRPSENQVSEDYVEERLERSEFHSWEDFHSYLDTWCLKNKMMFTVRQFVPLRNDHLSPDPQWSELAKSLKYSSVSMGCSASKTCPAVISLKLNSEKDKLILDKTMLHHNHNILEGNLPPPVTKNRLSALSCFPAKITNGISRKFLERNDLVKLQRFHPAQFEDRNHILNDLDALLISDPGVKVKLVFMENRLLVRNIFIMTSHMQDTIQQFPEYLFVDLLSHFGSHVDLYTVYCEDRNSEWKVCAMCIAQKGMSANVRFLMVSILQSIQNLSTQVKYITMNPDIREPLDMKSLIPFASLRYCMPLVLEMLYEKISYLGSIAEAKIKKILHNLTDSSPIAYNQYLKKLKATCPLEFFYYYYGTWHPHRKMWLKKDNRTQIAENNICNIIKFKHQALRAQVDTSSSLYHCLQVVLNDSMIALNATSSPHLQELPSVLETFPTDAPQQACESSREEELAQTEFSSWVDFCLFLDSWCEERKLLFTVRQWRTLTKEEISQCPSGPVLAQCLKYSMVQLFCTRKNCPAFIKLQLCPQKEKLIVSNSSFQHNHDLPETDFAPPLKRSKLMSTVGLPVQIANNISRKFLKPYDLNTLQRFLSGAFEDRSQVLKKLDSLFLSDPDAKVKLVFEENKLQVKDIFLMTSSMQQIAQCFPHYLYIDFLSGFSPGFDLYAVLCEEENVGWMACAYCIARKGTSDNLKFIVVSIFQSIPILNSQVKNVTVSPEIQDPLDIEDLVPCASLRYCMPLVLDLLCDKISYMNSEEEAQIKDFFHILAHTHSPAIYNQALNELKAACPAEIFQYYYETWHPRRKLWAEEYSSTPDTESSVSAYVKSKHQALTVQMGTSPSLHRCLRVVLNESKTALPITDFSSGYPEPAVSPTVVQQKGDVPAASLDEEEMEESSPERCSDSYIPNSQVGEAPVEKQLERNEFHSWQDFCSFLDDWCEERKLTFAIRRSVTLTEEDISQDPRGPEVAKSLRYSIVCMACSVVTRRKNCPAVIKLRLNPQKDKLIVTQAILHHNHDLPETALPLEKKQTRQMAPTDLPTRIANDISRKFLEHNDLRRLQRFRSYAFEDQNQVLMELVSLFISDPEAKVKLVFVEDKTLVKNIFLMTSHMQDIDHRFTGHLYVDLLADFSPGFALYIIFWEKEGMGWKVCAYSLARKGTSDILRFLMVSVLQSIPTLSTTVEHLTVSPEMEDPLDLEALVPHTSVRYCMPLVLELLYSKISHLDSAVQVHIKNILDNLAHSLSPETYSHSLTNLIAVCPADIFQYYYDIWHPRKKLWIRGQSENQAAENNICAFVKVKHLALIGQMGTSSSLHRCLQVVLNDSKSAMVGYETFLAQEAYSVIDTAATDSQLVGAGILPMDEVEQGADWESSADGSIEFYAFKSLASNSSEELKGRQFWSWAEFCEFFDSWCAQKKALYKIELAIPTDEISDQVWPEGIKYALVQLVCQKASADVPHLKTPLPGDVVCPCLSSITLQATEDYTQLSIVQAHLDHNHELDAWEFEALSSHFCLTTKTSHSTQLTSCISRRLLTPWDLQQLLAKQDTLDPALMDLLQELEALFLLDPACQVRLVFQPDTVEIDSLFLVTSHSRGLLQCYPTMLFLGRSLAVNDTFDLYTVLCEDMASQGRECAYFITRKESPAPIRLLVAFLIQSVPEVKSGTERIIVRADLNELDLIRELLPSCCVRMSQIHALHVLYKKLAKEEPPVQPKLKTVVNNVIHAHSPVLYNVFLQELEAAAPPDFLQYFLETWHRHKEDWVKCWGHRMRNGRFLEFAAWKLEELRSTLSFPSSLAACIQTLLKVVKEMAEEEVEKKVAQMSAVDEELLMPACPMSTAEGSSVPDLTLMPEDAIKQDTSKSYPLPGPTLPPLMPEHVIEHGEAERYPLPDPISLPPMPDCITEQDAPESHQLPNPASLPLIPTSIDEQDAAEIYPLPDLTSAAFMTDVVVKQEKTEMPDKEMNPADNILPASASIKQEGMEQPITVNTEYEICPSALTEPFEGWLKEEELEKALIQSWPAADNEDLEEAFAVDTHYEVAPSASTEDGIKEEDVELAVPVAGEADVPCLAATTENFPESITCEAVNESKGVTSSVENASTAIMDTSIDTDLKSELKDKSADLKGREFFSWMDFRIFFDVWCQENKALYKIKSSTPLDKVKIFRTHGTELVATLKYGFVRLACKHAFAMQSTPRKSPWESPPCPSNIILRASPCGDRLLITEAELEHNHQLSEEEVTRYFQKFKLKSKQNLLLGMTNNISKQFLEARDLQRMVERSSGEEPILQDLLRELTALFSMDSRAKVKLIFCPDSVAVDGIFLMTSRMRCLLQRFPSVLYLHWSMSVNEDFNLYTVLCEDEESTGCECAYFVARKDSETPIRFMVVSLLQCVPDVIKPQIQSVVVDASFKEVDLIRALLPKRTVVMSQTYALDTLYSRVAQEDLTVQETMRSIIHNLANAHSSDVYQRNLRELEAVSLVDFLQYFLENWHYRKEIWVACWGLSQSTISRFFKHIRFHQEKLAPILNPSVTLATYVGGLLRLQTLKMLTAMLDEEKISTLYQAVCSAASLKLIQEEISLTRQGSYEIKEHTRGFVLNDSISDFFINRTMSKCSCSIYTSSLLPCRHLFTTRLWAGEAIFDLKLIQEQ
ncbi:uncharacterized protein LOC115466454 isoform X2 [Microcaecilia unicolor]|uniref:Uncharacterized protein LOC115466454 isoform X2 n=1 Tax=Microcaecilia unicolor TaxID=1415580 RepID=A0A6P7XLW6_9AMPH|nr:uncharacterized protein LOC115466454 isoform X2 [Microcaecilia unicolor]